MRPPPARDGGERGDEALEALRVGEAAERLVLGGRADGDRERARVAREDGELHPAEVARDEVAARERSDRLRTVYETSMRRLIVIATGIVVFLRLTSGELLEPLRTPAGQVWLILPLGVWAGCLWWLQRLSRYELPRRYRLVSGTEARS